MISNAIDAHGPSIPLASCIPGGGWAFARTGRSTCNAFLGLTQLFYIIIVRLHVAILIHCNRY